MNHDNQNVMRHTALPLAGYLAAAALGALLFSVIGAPVAWLLGPMLASMALGLLLKPPAKGSTAASMLGQFMVGCIMGGRFSLETLQAGIGYAPPLIALIIFTAALCMVNGHLLRKLAGVDYQTAFLGTLPGAAAAVVAMAAELKVDRLMVTVLMYVRVILLIVFVPLVLSMFFADGATADAAPAPGFIETEPAFYLSLLTAALGVMGALLARRVRLPSPNFMGPFLLIMALKCVFPNTNLGLPAAALNGGLLLLGASVGLRCDIGRMRHYWKPALVQAGLVIGLLAACMMAGYSFHLLTGVDMLTAILGTTPGGKESMVALSMSMEANVELVMTMQTLRWLMILFLGPWMATWAARRKAFQAEAETPEDDIEAGEEG